METNDVMKLLSALLSSPEEMEALSLLVEKARAYDVLLSDAKDGSDVSMAVQRINQALVSVPHDSKRLAARKGVLTLMTKANAYDKINTPGLRDFWNDVHNEALHQRERWASVSDAGKTDADWFWLIGYLAGKALHNPPKDGWDADASRLHRIITVAAAAANWHAARLGETTMRPGIEAPNA